MTSMGSIKIKKEMFGSQLMRKNSTNAFNLTRGVPVSNTYFQVIYFAFYLTGLVYTADNIYTNLVSYLKYGSKLTSLV